MSKKFNYVVRHVSALFYKTAVELYRYMKDISWHEAARHVAVLAS